MFVYVASIPGGILEKYPNGTLTGLVKEYAILPILGMFQLTFDKLSIDQIKKAEDKYFSSGVTTANDLITSLLAANTYQLHDKDLKI